MPRRTTVSDINLAYWCTLGSQNASARAKMIAFEQAVARLRYELGCQIRKKEGPGGLLSCLCWCAPRYISFIATLRGEHRKLIDAVDMLHAHIRCAPVRDYEALLQQARSVMAAIEQHEELERAILRDALDPP